MLGLIPFPKVINLSINSHFDVLLENAFKAEQEVKYKADLGITEWCVQWNISRCAVTKGTVEMSISILIQETLFFVHALFRLVITVECCIKETTL